MDNAVRAKGPLPFLIVLCLAACGAEQPAEAPGAPSGPAAKVQPRTALSAPVEPLVEPVPLETLALEALFAARPIPITPEVQASLDLRTPQSEGWELEPLAVDAERALERLFVARGAGEALPAELLASEFASEAALDVDHPGRKARAPEVRVEITSSLPAGEGQLETLCLVSFLRRPAAAGAGESADLELLERGEAWEAHDGPFQLDLEFDALWRVGESGVRLVELELRPGSAERPAAVAQHGLFGEYTRTAFEADQAYLEELLRGPDAYYFHSDRLTNYDLVCSHGMAVGDLDGNGWDDLYLCMPPGIPNRLFMRQSDGSAREAGLQVGAAYLDSTRSALILDLDGDGMRDLACAVGGQILVHWNEGSGLSRPTFLRPPTPEDIYGLSAADYDLDGDLDLYACRYSAEGVMDGNPTPYHDSRDGARNLLWRNDGERKFSDVTVESGLDEGNDRYSFAAMWEDYDDDGDPDLYVANDFGRNHFWRNDGGRFVDVADAVGAEDMAAGMGVTAGDVDSDGDLDIYVSNIYSAEGLRSTSQGARFMGVRSLELLPRYQRHARGNTLLQNNGDGTFTDRSVASGSNRGGWAWGAQMFDVDNDGDLDLYSPNGFFTRRGVPQVDEYFWRHVIARSPADDTMSRAYNDAWYAIRYLSFERGEGWNGEETNVLFLGDGRGRFTDASGLSGADYPDDARVAVAMDWDHDGSLDLLLKNRNAPRIRLVRNRGNAATRDAWLAIELVGTPMNRDGVGARVRVLTDRGAQRRTVTAGDGFLAQSPARLHFGLGAGAAIQAIEVRWPDGLEERIEGPLAPGQALRIERATGKAETLPWQAMAALAGQAPEPQLELEGISGRSVLCDKLPLAPLTLPAFEQTERRVADLAGRPLLVTLWRVGDAASEGQLRRLAHERARIEAAGLQLVPLALDSGAALAAARRKCDELGLGESGGFVDGWTLQALEILLLEVFHRTENNPVPTSLLIDAAGQLCIVYHGPLQVSRLLEDVAVLSQMDPRMGTCARLQRGRWVERPRRDLNMLNKVFANLGYQEFADYYAARLAQPR